jgi:hypothetical protein
MFSRPALALAALASAHAHQDPPDLLAFDCAVSRLALEFATTKFPPSASAASPSSVTSAAELEAAVSLALHLEDCNGTGTPTAPAPAPPPPPPPPLPHQGSTTAARAVGAIELFVDPQGSDATGTGAKDAPFATPHAARDALRTRRRSAPAAGATIWLREGTYYFGGEGGPGVLVLEEGDGGASADAPVVYAAYGGEAVTLSGGVALGALQWQLHDAATNAYRAPLLPATASAASIGAGALFAGGRRAIKARYPNGNPEDLSGMCFSKVQRAQHGEGCRGGLPQGKNAKMAPLTAGLRLTAALAAGPSRRDGSMYPSFDLQAGGFCGLFAGPAGRCIDNATAASGGTLVCDARNATGGSGCTVPCSDPGSLPWCAHYDRVRNVPVSFQPQQPLPREWANVTRGAGAAVRGFEGSTWGSQAWPLTGVRQDGTLTLGPGGTQIGDSNGAPNNWYVEHVLEELDAPLEYFADAADEFLYFVPNTTAAHGAVSASPPKLLEAATMPTVVAFAGSADAPVSHMHLRNVRVAHTAPTELALPSAYEIPSGGDWAVGRVGALTLSGASGIVIDGCHLDRVGGNGVLLSGWAKNNTVRGNRIGFPGESAMVALGDAQLLDGTGGTFPEGNVIEHNWMHDIGVFGKEVSCYFQAVSGRNTIANNVCYNGPRAGINFNDGFLGGNVVSGNLVFNMVRETSDHGPFNSWDRVPFVTMQPYDPAAPTPAPPPPTPAPPPPTPAPVPGRTCAVGASLGCFQDADKSGRILPTRIGGDTHPNDPQLTQDKCATECDALLGPGATAFVGVESSTQCYCGSAAQAPSPSKKLDSGCGDACSGNRTQLCGGSWQLGVFAMGACHDPPAPRGGPTPGDLVPTITPIRNRLEGNLIINGYNGVWALDHDDGSSFYNDSSNVLVFGGCKNYKGDHKTCGPDNLILYPGIASRSSGGHSCQTNDNKGTFNNAYEGNDCVQYDGQFYTFSGGSLNPADNPSTSNNRFYSPNATFNYNGHSLVDLQRAGMDLGSTVSATPSTAALLELARARLSMPRAPPLP